MTDNKYLTKDDAIKFMMSNPMKCVIDIKTNVIWTFMNLTSSTSNNVLDIEDYNRFPNSMFSKIGN